MKKINEKFTEDSDPIRDMGIGKEVFWSKERDIIETLSNDEVYKKYFKKVLSIADARDKSLLRFVLLQTLKLMTNGKGVPSTDAFIITCGLNRESAKLRAKYIFPKVRKVLNDYFHAEISINEAFTEDSDPIHDMGIGMKQKLKAFIKELKEDKHPNMTFKPEHNNDNDLLWITARYGRLDLVKFLLDKGADIHHEDDRAVRWAICNDYYDVAKFLIDRGSTVGTRDHTGKTARDLARDTRNPKMIELIEQQYTKHVNEKFEEESDPVKDMNIGGINRPIDFKNYIDYHQFLLDNFLTILKLKKIPSNFFPSANSGDSGEINETHFIKIDEYIDKYVTVKKENPNSLDEKTAYFWPSILKHNIMNKIKMVTSDTLREAVKKL